MMHPYVNSRDNPRVVPTLHKWARKPRPYDANRYNNAMNWIEYVLWWYGILLLLGLIFFPVTKLLFHNFFDFGYPFAKTIAIIVVTYTTFILGVLHIVPFSQTSLVVLLLLFALLNYVLWKKDKSNLIITKSVLRMIIFQELLFFMSLLFLAFVRGQEPSIRGLEKFMDFGFMQSILRTNYFPPLDIWYSGFPINYYYFGHLSGAFLIKLTGIPSPIGYNLILATIFAQGITLTFSLVCTIARSFSQKISSLSVIAYGLLGSFIVNFAGNLHTIYLFTKGYPADNPVPFWQIFSAYNPTSYWYPNATRFIPFTIHEFPAYSYIVADLHGHVFDIPFVLLTLSVLFSLFITSRRPGTGTIILLGFLTAVHYMTNAFDGPIYLLLSTAVLFALFRCTKQFWIMVGLLFGSFVVFSLPFSAFFSPFIGGIGVNCSPDFLTATQEVRKIGPFLFERGKCQITAPWMLFVLWGFFWVNFLLLITLMRKKKLLALDTFMFLLFTFGTILIIIPEFFYIKDIYPAHFRANTMFKLGYQAFMMMGIASSYTLMRIKMRPHILHGLIFALVFFFVFLYPFYGFPSYYGNLSKIPQLDGSRWLTATYPEDKEIIEYLNRIPGQPIILEAQGDSYTDYERISAYTGLPTVAGWWVHEWLWRGSSDVVGKRIPDVTAIYESSDPIQVLTLLHTYRVRYVVVAPQERNKYLHLSEDKFSLIGKKIFTTTNQRGAIYQID